MSLKPHFVVLISADAEWHVVRDYFRNSVVNNSPYGEWLSYKFIDISDLIEPVIFIHGGWGKVAAGGSTQYLISRWHPRLLVNLGICGGFEGKIKRGEIILVDQTIIYDIYEQMGDPDTHISHYITQIDTSWVNCPYPLPVFRSKMVSADRDLLSDEIKMLSEKYDAIVGDWESGAIAWVAAKNHTPCLLLRGVTDIVGEKGGEAYNGNQELFFRNTETIMKKLLDSLSDWLLLFKASNK